MRVYGDAAKSAKARGRTCGAIMSDIVDGANRRRKRTPLHHRRVEKLASELAKFGPDFVDDFLRRMIADAGPNDEIRRDIADFADEVRDAISRSDRRTGATSR